MESSKVFYQLNGISLPFDEQSDGLVNFSIDFLDEQRTLILGPEGSGKSKLIDLLTGFRLPEKGSLYISGKNIKDYSESELNAYRSTIGYVSYFFGLLSNLTVYENIALPLTFHTRYTKLQISRLIDPLLDEFSLAEVRNARPRSLNQNEKLRASFLRAIQLKPRYLIFDHILSGQCPVAMRAFLNDAFAKIKEIKCGVLFSEFNADVSLEFSEQVILIYKGEKKFQGSVKEFKSTNNSYAGQFAGRISSGPMQAFFNASLK